MVPHGSVCHSLHSSDPAPAAPEPCPAPGWLTHTRHPAGDSSGTLALRAAEQGLTLLHSCDVGMAEFLPLQELSCKASAWSKASECGTKYHSGLEGSDGINTIPVISNSHPTSPT